MDVLKVRHIARVSTGMGSLAIIVGGVMMATHIENLGDVIMITGCILLILGVAALAQTPTGDSDGD